MTLQTLAVLTLGALFGARLAAATLTLYLAEGLVGLPVFAGAIAGPAYMVGPTGGYLVGFLVAAALVGGLAERGWTALAGCSPPWRLAISFCSPPGSRGWRADRRRQGLGVGVAPFSAATSPRPCSPPRLRSPRAALRRAAAWAERRDEARPRRARRSDRAAFARFVDDDALARQRRLRPLNNVAYYELFDAAVNQILIEAGLLDPASSPIIGFVAESNCRFFAAVVPRRIEIGVKVERLGRASVRYAWRRSRRARRWPARRDATPTSTSIGPPASLRHSGGTSSAINMRALAVPRRNRQMISCE